MDVVLALDAGTTGVRCVAFDDSARALDSAYRELTQHFPSPGEIEHDAAEIAELAVATLREVATRSRHRGERVVALGITNQRETTVAFDRENAHLAHRALVWQDRRTAARCAQLELDGHGDQVRASTGLVLDAYFSATKMQWLLQRGVLDAASAPSLATVDTWLLWWLTGNVEGGAFATEPSNASRTMLMDLDTLDWSATMTSLFDVPRSMLADIRPSSANFGTVSAEVVPELAGVPITGILGDQQAALFGQACFETGVVKATYGTGAFVLTNAGDSAPGVFPGLLTSVAWDLGAFGPATYCVEGSAFVAGAAVQWLRDELGFVVNSDELESLATSVPDSAGAQFVPAFTGLGSPFWRSEARGAIMGLSRGVGRAQIARALVEALAYQVRAITDAFADAGVTLREMRADGGAAAMDLLMQLQATNSRLTVRRSRSLEATARGAATLAGLDIGLWGSLDELAALWEYERVFEPGDPLFIDAGYQAWRRALERA
ncbi:MAG TPA: glycerol kinase GlpK [Acidimicrobiales bacterium]|nr:glycerol kinase GlpK [Acidimicrobiales bacterium]